jgi:hypothetical protein
MKSYSDGAGCRGRGVVVPHVDSVQKAESDCKSFTFQAQRTAVRWFDVGLALPRGDVLVRVHRQSSGANYEEPRR